MDEIRRYHTIVLDPPWDFGNKTGRHGTTYQTMTIPEIEAFGQQWLVPHMAGTWCHVYLWVIDAHLGYAYPLLTSWGCVPKTTLVWVKKNIGMGNYYRHQHELCIFAVKGKTQRLLRQNASTVFEAEVDGHSVKPAQFYDLVESCSPGPYLDIFARQCRDGWDVIGNDVNAQFQLKMYDSVGESRHLQEVPHETARLFREP